MSAWIEITNVIDIWGTDGVALLVSAWIEISASGGHVIVKSGRTPRECVD